MNNADTSMPRDPVDRARLEGRLAGEAAGYPKGVALAVVALLSERFGPEALPDGLAARLSGLGPDALGVIVERSAAARSIQEALVSLNDGTTHETDAHPDAFEAYLSGANRHAILRSEAVRAGDRLMVHERADGERTGRSHLMDVTYVTHAANPCALSPEGLRPGHSILSVETADRPR